MLSEKMTVKLTGPFSPFATALRNIRDNLISKAKPITVIDIQEEYLLTTVGLSITDPLDPGWIVEFPIAACWSPDQEPVFQYSGEYAHVRTSTKSDQLKSISQNIEKKIREIVISGATKGRFGAFPFEGDRTNYPESLRRVKGFWRFDVSSQDLQLNFLIFLSHGPDFDGPDSVDTKDTSIKQIRKYLNDYFREGIDELIPLTHRHRRSKAKANFSLSYPVLRNTLSNILYEIDLLATDKTARLASNVTKEEDDFRNAFKIVFVRPVRMANGCAGFRYVLSFQQIEYLDKQTAESFQKRISQSEKRFYGTLDGEIKELQEHLGSSLPALREIPIETIKRNDDLGVLIRFLSKEKLHMVHGRIEEFLRKAIYIFYAFSDASKNSLIEQTADHLAIALEAGRGDVTSKQAFLITQVFASRRAHIVENYINHPFSKHLQYSTDALIKVFENNFNDGQFYPAFVHLFETLVLPRRLFMYPIFQRDSPLLLSACDAYHYAAIQTDFKSVLDRNAPGIFNSIMGFELAQTNSLLTEIVQDIRGGASEGEKEEEVIKLIGERLRHVTLHFCPNPSDLEKAEVLETPMSIDRQEKLIDVDSGDRYAKIKFTQLSKELKLHRNGRRFITDSSDGQNLLRFYLRVVADIFSRYFGVRKLANTETALELSRKQYEIQAHEVKRVISAIRDKTPGYLLDQIRAYFDTLFAITVDSFVAGGTAIFDSEYPTGNELTELIRNATRIAARIQKVVSWAVSGNIQHEKVELEDASEQVLDRLIINCGIRKMTQVVEEEKAAFFGALVCGLRNTLKHSPSMSKIQIFLNEKTAYLHILNEASYRLRGDGTEEGDVLSPGHTQDALDFYARLYESDGRKSDMYWDPEVKRYVTMIPYPRNMFEEGR